MNELRGEARDLAKTIVSYCKGHYIPNDNFEIRPSDMSPDVYAEQLIFYHLAALTAERDELREQVNVYGKAISLFREGEHETAEKVLSAMGCVQKGLRKESE